jgi:hypothetical protein
MKENEGKFLPVASCGKTVEMPRATRMLEE